MFKTDSPIVNEVATIYRWVDGEVARLHPSCKACGACCDFEAFGHRLYVTTPELLHFKTFAGPTILDMPGGVCPYRVDGQCSVYPYRFSGCRIFSCSGDSEAENQLSEAAIRQFKGLCEAYGIPYRYVYLKEGLEMLRKSVGTKSESAGLGAFGK